MSPAQCPFFLRQGTWFLLKDTNLFHKFLSTFLLTTPNPSLVQLELSPNCHFCPEGSVWHLTLPTSNPWSPHHSLATYSNISLNLICFWDRVLQCNPLQFSLIFSLVSCPFLQPQTKLTASYFWHFSNLQISQKKGALKHLHKNKPESCLNPVKP